MDDEKWWQKHSYSADLPGQPVQGSHINVSSEILWGEDNNSKEKCSRGASIIEKHFKIDTVSTALFWEEVSTADKPLSARS